jgi:hypothetical protein
MYVFNAEHVMSVVFKRCFRGERRLHRLQNKLKSGELSSSEKIQISSQFAIIFTLLMAMTGCKV